MLQSTTIVDDAFAMIAWARMLSQRSYLRSLQDDVESQNYLNTLKMLDEGGVDNEGRTIIRILGKNIQDSTVEKSKIKQYLLSKINRYCMDHKSLCIVYFSEKGGSSSGLAILKWLHRNVSETSKNKLEAIYFVHPGIQTKLLLSSVARAFVDHEIYEKVQCIDRVEYLWDHMQRGEIEIPESAWEYDQELEGRPMSGHGIGTNPTNPIMGYDNLTTPSPPMFHGYSSMFPI